MSTLYISMHDCMLELVFKIQGKLTVMYVFRLVSVTQHVVSYGFQGLFHFQIIHVTALN